MTWIDDNKGAGPWGFTEQGDKWGYLNNPRWSNGKKGAADSMSASEFCEEKGISLEPEETHRPCGHWHKRREIIESIYPGNLYACGAAHAGQLGLNFDYAIGYNAPHTLASGVWLKVACGYWHSIAIKNDGTLWATGENQNGQLGLGDTTDRFEWEQVGSDTDWAKVFCGTNCSLAIKTDGSLYACGSNSYGAIGFDNGGNDVDTITLLSSDSWLTVASGSIHSVAIKSDGTMWGTGYNGLGQLGLGDNTDRAVLTQIPGSGWVDVGCCESDTLALKSDGTLWGTGENWAFELGLGHDNEVNEFTQVGSDTDWDNIDCGATFSLAVKTNGALYGAGYNAYGELGFDWEWPDDKEYIETFTQMGTDTNWAKAIGGIESSAVIKTNGELWTTGENGHGQLGLGDHTRRYELTQVSGSYNEVAVGWNHSIVINSDGELKGMGTQRYGPLGTGYVTNITKLTLANDETWLAVDCWYAHALAIKDDKSLYGTGYNSYGQLGLGDRTSLRYVYTLINSALSWKQVATGNYHSLALTEDGVIYSFGYNYYGQLGLGVFGSVSIYRYYDELTQVSGSDWAFIAAGSQVSFAIDTDGLLYACGHNSSGNYGQLGLGDNESRSSFTQCIGTGWKQVSVGSCHAAAVRDNGTLWTTGKNTYGQLGLGDYDQRTIWTQVGSDTDWDYTECGYNFTLAVKTDGALYGTGVNTRGQLGLNDETNRNTFTEISSGWLHGGYEGMAEFSGGDSHSAAIYGNNYIKTTGENLNGQLATGEIGAAYERDEFDDIVDSIPVDGEQDLWEFVVSGLDSTFALKIVSGTETTTYNDDDEPQIWSLPTKGPSL